MRPRPSSGWFFGGAAGSPWQDRVLFSGFLLQGFLRPGSSVLETRSGAMSRLGSVQRKMPCVFVTEVKAEPSAKREHQVPGGLGCWAASPTLRGGPGALQVLQGRFGWSTPWAPASWTFFVVRSVGESLFFIFPSQIKWFKLALAGLKTYIAINGFLPTPAPLRGQPEKRVRYQGRLTWNECRSTGWWESFVYLLCLRNPWQCWQLAWLGR